jgi:AcrR family transcriptional regulator
MIFFAPFYNKLKFLEAENRNIAKADQIIKVAQDLFGIYGFEKVSMSEISNELRLSKASLYYYFPDKESLCIAVVEKEREEFITRLTEIINSIEDPEKMLKEYVVLRLGYFRRFLNLSRLRQETYSGMRPVFRETLMRFRDKELEIVTGILNKGIEGGKFFIEDPVKTASLLLDILKGLGSSVVNFKRTMILEQEDYELLLDKMTFFSGIFIKGLKSR